MFVCYNYADKFLHLYIETHVSQTFINSSKTLLYYGGTFNVFRGPNMVSNFQGKQCNAVILQVELTNIGCTLGGTPMSAV